MNRLTIVRHVEIELIILKADIEFGESLKKGHFLFIRGRDDSQHKGWFLSWKLHQFSPTGSNGLNRTSSL